jgi:putative ABC transport system ATP-binding protein
MSINAPEGAATYPVAAPHERADKTPHAVVTARDIVRRYGEGDTAVDALRGVSVDIAEGRLTAVMGPSGSGKSTLMHILAGLDQPTAGEVTVAGIDVTNLGDDDLTKLRRDHIGFIFQFFNLLPMLTAAENIALPLKLAGGKPDTDWLEELVDKVGLSDRLTHRPSELSGGQQQRVAVARALVSRPSVMFADEPTGNLDSTTSGEILALLRDSVDTLGQTTVMVTHDAHAAAIADRVLFLADGHIVEDLGRSTAHEILETLEQVSGR